MTVLGHVRVLQAATNQEVPQMVRMVRAEVDQALINSPIGWSANNSGYIVGRHLSDSFQDPSLAFPTLHSAQFRSTLVKGDDGLWYTLELNEPLRLIIQPDSKFRDMNGMRRTTAVVTEGEKLPGLMGFKFEGEGVGGEQFESKDDPGDEVLVAPEDEIQGAEIAAQDVGMHEGREVGEAHVVVRPARDDEVIVDGITLTSKSSLASLRAGCRSYGISTSGSEVKYFGRLRNHQKSLELQTITHAAQDALNAEVRVPNGPSLPKPPNNAVQDAHRLTHTPYQPWCESCVAHRARADKHVHDFSSMEGSTKAGEAVRSLML